MTSQGYVIPQSGGSQKLAKNRATRTRRAECISIMPDGTTTVFRKAAATATPRTKTPRTTIVKQATKQEIARELIMRLPATNGGNPDA
jgi:hypothetical protein